VAFGLLSCAGKAPRERIGGDSMRQFVNDFFEALSACVQLGFAVPLLLTALFGPSIGIILLILWAAGVF
jgi:hypothetical protein